MSRRAAYVHAAAFAIAWLGLRAWSALSGVEGLAAIGDMLIYPVAAYCLGYATALREFS